MEVSNPSNIEVNTKFTYLEIQWIHYKNLIDLCE